MKRTSYLVWVKVVVVKVVKVMVVVLYDGER